MHTSWLDRIRAGGIWRSIATRLVAMENAAAMPEGRLLERRIRALELQLAELRSTSDPADDQSRGRDPRLGGWEPPDRPSRREPTRAHPPARGTDASSFPRWSAGNPAGAAAYGTGLEALARIESAPPS